MGSIISLLLHRLYFVSTNLESRARSKRCVHVHLCFTALKGGLYGNLQLIVTSFVPLPVRNCNTVNSYTDLSCIRSLQIPGIAIANACTLCPGILLGLQSTLLVNYITVIASSPGSTQKIGPFLAFLGWGLGTSALLYHHTDDTKYCKLCTILKLPVVKLVDGAH